ncbi:sugar-transfer associated ATP-grasp domain-containing protein [Winogradskyella luteola]|uniref:Alpha-L-glutamate ligase-related protein ATP-grasp domain-containing protein n=1 Tax=Winogradskyella luteola TaxID=2828330 RepID=A0A9X1JRE4_9FLAO|nr:sugar-transfer associated ATP-grasp domain-containing protein [Winogradskyella luteola]MBV7268522.1 hypothetical protein [Winogradskyella luteola]
MTNIEYKIKWHFKHKRSKKRALKILKTIESYRGKTNLKLIKQSNEYAKEALGDKRYAPWIYVYCAMQNRFKEGWIPDDYYKKEVVPRQKGDYGSLADRNFVAPLLFKTVDTLNVGYFLNGMFCTSENKILPFDKVKSYLFEEYDKLVYKLENSKQGKGVFVLEKNSFNTTNFLSKASGNGVFQKFIKQHDFFSQFTANSVATIRITTASDKKGLVSTRAAYVRFGREKDRHILSNSAISVPMDINTGELNAVGYMKWKELKMHPDSKISFKDKVIPNFGKCKSKVLEMHGSIPFMGCIGWDMAVDKFGEAQLIEWNGNNNGIKFSEATTGPCFKGLGWEKLWKENYHPHKD